MAKLPFVDDERAFEDEVRRVARLLWPRAEFGGAELVQERERDGIFVTEDAIYLVEATTSRKLEKAKTDITKLARLYDAMRRKHPDRAIKGWFVTLDEPTADQRKVTQKHQGMIVAVSFDQFRSRLVDARSYLTARFEYPFGSARDPETGDSRRLVDYVPLDMVSTADEALWTLETLEGALKEGRLVVLLGDYGSGKSTTLRELFIRLGDGFSRHESRRFPVVLNLRDHHGQTDPVEALERHARRVGYPGASHHLVRAWRAGYLIILLDGFDEIATAGWTAQVKKLRDLRYRSMELIRTFLRETPTGTGIVLAGRAHYFDSPRELERALGLRPGFVSLTLSEFTDDQIATYLKRRGWDQAVPAWLPSRPLLIGYLASRDLLRQTLEVTAGSSPASGWNELLTRICHREAEIEAGIDGETVRVVIERLASKARARPSGLGPLQQSDMVETFKDTCGSEPDDKGIVLLQRLPGLGVANPEDGSRGFIDRDLVQVAAAGDVTRYVSDPFGGIISDPSGWQSALEPLGVEVVALRCQHFQKASGKLVTAARRASQERGWDVLTADVSLVIQELGFDVTGDFLDVEEAFVPMIELDERSGDLSALRYRSCLVGVLALPSADGGSRLPRFQNCYFGIVEGRVGPVDLPAGVFDAACQYEVFGEAGTTTSGILKLELPIGTRVMLTVLKKLYLQAGSGRKESALYRGLDQRERSMVSSVLGLLRSQELAVPTKVSQQSVWIPVRAATGRVRKIIAQPNTCGDVLIVKSAELES